MSELQVLQIVDVTIVDLPLHIALHVHQLADGDIDGLLVGVELVLLIVGIVDPEGIVADGSGSPLTLAAASSSLEMYWPSSMVWVAL